jgi:hypothetical protein
MHFAYSCLPYIAHTPAVAPAPCTRRCSTPRDRADPQMPACHDVPAGDMYIEYTIVMPTEIKAESRARKLFSFLYSSDLRTQAAASF